jgi:hypothetical protein
MGVAGLCEAVGNYWGLLLFSKERWRS